MAASAPFVIHIFRPLSTQESPRCSARADIPNASDPDAGSDSAYAPTVPLARRGGVAEHQLLVTQLREWWTSRGKIRVHRQNIRRDGRVPPSARAGLR